MTYTLKKRLVLRTQQKGSVDVKSFQMSGNAETDNKKILRNLKRFFTWTHDLNLLRETFFGFVVKTNKLSGFVGKNRTSGFCTKPF